MGPEARGRVRRRRALELKALLRGPREGVEFGVQLDRVVAGVLGVGDDEVVSRHRRLLGLVLGPQEDAVPVLVRSQRSRAERQPLEVLRILGAVGVEDPRDLQLIGNRPGVHVDAVVVGVGDVRVCLLVSASADSRARASGRRQLSRGGGLSRLGKSNTRSPSREAVSRPRSRRACRGRDPPRESFAAGGSPSSSGACSTSVLRTSPSACPTAARARSRACTRPGSCRRARARGYRWRRSGCGCTYRPAPARRSGTEVVPRRRSGRPTRTGSAAP